MSTISTTDYRGAYHFSPNEKWMNDPNGMVFSKASIICSINIIHLVPHGDRCIGACRDQGSVYLGRASCGYGAG